MSDFKTQNDSENKPPVFRVHDIEDEEDEEGDNDNEEAKIIKLTQVLIIFSIKEKNY